MLPSAHRLAALGLVKTLRLKGFDAYFAGGCVRDALLGLAPKDYDIATNATPDQVIKLLPRCRLVGKAFGVIISQPARDICIEVATFRTDGSYSDGRRPDFVTFTDAKGDAQRRDFSINGLFADPQEDGADKILDFVGGMADLKAGMIRAIGNPSERFGEDYLRLLRAVRFAARLNFKIEEKTKVALIEYAPKLAGIARERIGDEVRRMMLHNNWTLAVQLLEETTLAGVALGVNAAHLSGARAGCSQISGEDKQPCEQPARAPLTVEALSPNAAYPTRLFSWLFDRGSLNLDAVRIGLNLTNEERDALHALPLLLKRADFWQGLSVSKRKRLLAEKEWQQAHLFLHAQNAALAQQIAADTTTLSSDGIGIAPPPFLNGGALLALGLKPSPRFKQLLEESYDLQLEGKLKSTEEAIAWARAH